MNGVTPAASALLLFSLVRPAWGAQFGDAAVGLALTIAAVWSLHPLPKPAVTYPVQRAESLMGFFYLLTLDAFARGTDAAAAAGSRRRWLGRSVVACALGLGTKEVMATAPLLVGLSERTFVAGSWRTAWRERRGFYVALGATSVLLAALVFSTGGNRGGTVASAWACRSGRIHLHSSKRSAVTFGSRCGPIRSSSNTARSGWGGPVT